MEKHSFIHLIFYLGAKWKMTLQTNPPKFPRSHKIFCISPRKIERFLGASKPLNHIFSFVSVGSRPLLLFLTRANNHFEPGRLAGLKNEVHSFGQLWVECEADYEFISGAISVRDYDKLLHSNISEEMGSSLLIK